jgi:hypothetical protein
VTPIIGDLISNTIGKVVEGGIEIIKKLIPDKDKQLQAENELRTMGLAMSQEALKLEHTERMAQAEIAKIDAASPDKYQRRARPTTIWICNLALAYVFVGHPLLQWFLATSLAWTSRLANVTAPPLPDAEYLFMLLGALLGFGGYRSYEKVKGVAR